MATAIEFNHVSKLYRLGLVSTGTFREDVKHWWVTSVRHKEDPFLTIGETNDRGTRGESQFVWALRDIDFKVEQGDVVGIIGKNGAGKSTLLKILSKITAPTTGEIRARGRVASLLEVGTGMHPEMTGRENIYLNGAILGMTKQEITRKLDEIIDFSGCERYIDTPVKRYSSGMRVRLGFAVAAHLDPDILVVDEVLAVGDAEFQKKAIGKMQDVSKGEGRTVLFVSHNMDSVLNLCQTGVLIEDGKVKLISTAKDVIDAYTSSSIIGSSYTGNRPNNTAYISQIQYYNNQNITTNHFTTEEPIIIRTIIRKNPGYQIANTAKYSINIFRKARRICILECSLDILNAENEVIVDFELPKQFFTSGPIYLDAGVHVPNIEIIDAVYSVCHCEIIDSGTDTLKYNGIDCGVVLAHPIIRISATHEMQTL